MAEKFEASEPHKATMRRHYAESVASGVAPDVIHRELRDEVFAQTGKYSTQQITATTSWIAGEILKGRRTNDIVWDEGPNDTNEDSNFDNPEKNRSRNWQTDQLLQHTTLDQRQRMNFLLLPGQNSYDFEAFTNIGFNGRNFLTYILGKHPKAVAQYLRNCRKYDVQNRRVGKMDQLFREEPTRIQGGYIDYFGQFSPNCALDAMLLPLEADGHPICLGFNFKKGREHGTTKEAGNVIRAHREYIDEHKDDVIDGSDIAQLHIRARGSEVDSNLEMKDLRDEMVFDTMFSYAGVAQQRNWPASDLIKNFTRSALGNEDFDDLPILEQYGRVRQQLQSFILIVSQMDRFAEELKIHTWMAGVAGAVAGAAVNTPIIRHLAEPCSYRSGESNQPFQSYFGVLETKKSHYEKYADAMEFMFALGGVFLKDAEKVARGEVAKVITNIHDVVTVSGLGSKKEIVVLRSGKPIAKINHDYLLEAAFELGLFGCSVQKPGETYESRLRTERELLEDRKGRGKAEESEQALLSSLLRALQRSSGLRMPLARNSPCACGSGRKFKKCCMKC